VIHAQPPWRRGWNLVQALVAYWSSDNCLRKSAALAFYTAFSIAPLLVIVLVIGSLVVDAAAMQRELIAQARSLLGQDGASFLADVLARSQTSGQGWSALFAGAVLVFGATTAFGELKDSLDEIFQSEGPLQTGFFALVRSRLLAFGLVLVLALLLIATLAANALFSGASGYLDSRFGFDPAWLGRLFSSLLSFAGAFALFAAVYGLLPARRLHWRALVVGAAASTVLFSIGRALFGLYLSSTDVVTAFGTAGSLAVVLLWVYYSAMAFFAGAEMARLYAHGDLEKTLELEPGTIMPASHPEDMQPQRTWTPAEAMRDRAA
jgi:membrane protein